MVSLHLYSVFFFVLPDAQQVKRDCKKLCGNGYDDKVHRADVVQNAQNPASEEPCDAKSRFKDTKARASHMFRNNLAGRRLHDAFLRAHADAPKENSHSHHPLRVSKEEA